MKKLFIAACVATGLTHVCSIAMADTPDTGPGCGVGPIVFDGQSGVVPNVLAATTNGTAGNQTFGMTTGTFGCDTTQPIGGSSAVATYLDDNLDNVAQDMARGEGEALASLARVIGIQAEEQQAFFTTVQNEFDNIFASSDVTRQEVMANLHQVLAAHAELNKYAARV